MSSDINVVHHLVKNDKRYWKEVQLARVKAFNALNAEMLRGIREAVSTGEKDSLCLGLILTSSNPRAFCSGGDVKALAQVAKQDSKAKVLDEFFDLEYETDLMIHQSKLPIISWCHGLTMGGGVGISVGASHRVVTSTTLWAMPEVSIGLFPDIGSSFFLGQHFNQAMGLFLGITGARLLADDLLNLGLADYKVDGQDAQSFIDTLVKTKWPDGLQEIRSTLDQALGRLSQDYDKDSLLDLNSEVTKAIDLGSGLSETLISLRDYNFVTQRGKAAQQTMLDGSVLSAALAVKLYKESKSLKNSISDCFKREGMLAKKMIRHEGFLEGVRALLIDKDKSPKWPISWKEIETANAEAQILLK